MGVFGLVGTGGGAVVGVQGTPNSLLPATQLPTIVGVMTPTANELLAAKRLRRPLPAWVTAQREEGLSWNTIALVLRDLTKGEVAVTGEALRKRYGQQTEEEQT